MCTLANKCCFIKGKYYSSSYNSLITKLFRLKQFFNNEYLNLFIPGNVNKPFPVSGLNEALSYVRYSRFLIPRFKSFLDSRESHSLLAHQTNGADVWMNAAHTRILLKFASRARI